MSRFAHRSLSLLLLLTALAASNAFAPGNHKQHHAIAAPSSCSKVKSSISRRAVVPITALRQSSNDDDGSSTINIALITATINYNDELQTALKEHPFCKMTGVQLSFADVQATSAETSSFSKENVADLQRAEIACFENMSAVKSYLQMLDDNLNVLKDISDEDRRKLPNKPAGTDDVVLMAACPNANTARKCLDSGRWMSNHIYYPKDTQKAVELKAQPIGDEGSEGEVVQEEEEEEDVDVKVWADSVAQAAGDAYERNAWGGGW
eukprot:CAMPEP_0172328594 /NCGR_PEP_ID=MMETSP1058-20130122/60434_1 /TAXON_ID=83371 /ORGANISM="Detonula confervacea, Strain CCMP 353" /LENGTH=264 /DNA_ID=CAMNT_0013045715 /DNA_START=618 /DNA_END=1412 /DNA_ORIENTATION=+